MSKSIGQKIRKQLDLPWKDKNKLFFLFFPLLFFISLAIHVISKKKREKSYLKLYSFFDSKQSGFKIVCIGNVILGGTGKSPLVRKCALEYLNKGYLVAIASRGVGKNIVPVNIGKNYNVDKLSLLSDENREHYEILNHDSFKNSKFYILQSKKRLESLKFFLNEIHINNYDINKTIFILDDGLQHFSCPRDYNICVWSPNILINSPNFCIPIGPYREGFGKDSFINLLNNFDFRFWSRTKFENRDQFKENLIKSLEQYQIKPSQKDLIIQYKNNFYTINTSHQDFINIQNEIDEVQAIKYFYDIDTITIITGIANPENFIIDLKNIINNKKIKHIFLDDHSNLTNHSISLLENSQCLMITLKDLFRWHQNPKFYKSIKNKKIIGCTIDANLLNLEYNTISFESILT
ncbi:tetraacyldisaccharide 4'-kinase [Spirobacillus cienkowskii]|uniref:tetraacyldisaccharide 4'-kinase n=1 Tax=Spirobacillus cienkowskii TaxID=495820 RepID=UPI0030CE79D7